MGSIARFLTTVEIGRFHQNPTVWTVGVFGSSRKRELFTLLRRRWVDRWQVKEVRTQIDSKIQNTNPVTLWYTDSCANLIVKIQSISAGRPDSLRATVVMEMANNLVLGVSVGI